jgi:tRNA-specific adenosine deaminase 2
MQKRSRNKMSKYDAQFMKEALVVAQDAYEHLEVPVGCVFVLNNETILARGRNKPNESYNVSDQASF